MRSHLGSRPTDRGQSTQRAIPQIAAFWHTAISCGRPLRQLRRMMLSCAWRAAGTGWQQHGLMAQNLNSTVAYPESMFIPWLAIQTLTCADQPDPAW